MVKQQIGPKQTPNISWICSDQQRYDTIQALGCELMMKSFDALAFAVDTGPKRIARGQRRRHDLSTFW
jgi:hypothetical protein